MLTIDRLRELHDLGEIDTVLVVFPDMQGRFMGKRVLSSFFLSEVHNNGGAIEACDYLLAVDVDMKVLDGFRFTSWETGYGDFVCRPDLSTLHLVPWLEKTALVIGDLVDHDDAPIEVSPRAILQRQLGLAADQGYTVKAGTELEFFLFQESMEQAWKQDFKGLTPSSPYVIDYHILQTSKDEWLIRKIRNDMAAAGIPVENSKGEAGLGQHELNLRYAEALVMADNHTIYKNGAKEIAALAGKAITFMAKHHIDEVGSSCHIHSSLWDTATDRSLMPDESGHGLSDTFRFLAGCSHRRRFALCWAFIAATSATSPPVGSPSAGARQPRSASGWASQGMRVESRVPGADCNPYIALAATVAGGLYGIDNKIEPGDVFAGNGYESDLPRIPHTLVDAIAAWENSEIAKAAFGDDVHFHLLHMARQEWLEFNNHVTDWELRRNFERL